MTVRLSVIGLERTGVSIGLTLADKSKAVCCLGYDPNPEICKQVKKLGIFNKIAKNWQGAVSLEDMVMLAVPVDEIYATLKKIAPHLKPNTIVIDTSPLQIAVAAWVKELLPKDVYFIALTPMFNPAYLYEIGNSFKNARADLFEKSLLVITNAADTRGKIIDLAVNLAVLLGGVPYFADPYEVDGLLSASKFLPQLTAAAIAMANFNQPGWQEGKKMAGSAFAYVTALLGEFEERNELGLSFIENRENMVRVINNVISAFTQLRQTIEAKDEQALKDLLVELKEARLSWMEQRREGKWTYEIASSIPTKEQALKCFSNIGGSE